MDHRLLCEKALIAGPTLHCTLIYGWNLLTRPDTTYNVKWAHFARVDDHITATINKHKADQGGIVNSRYEASLLIQLTPYSVLSSPFF